MPVRKKRNLTSWSYSRKSTYDRCPAQAFYKFILRIQEPGNEAMARGSKLGDEAEAYAVDKRKRRMPEICERFAEEFRALRKLPRKAGLRRQLEFAVTKDWQPCDWKDWNRAWLRAKLDLMYHEDDHTVVVIDLKTGRFRPEYQEQLEIYAAVVVANVPEQVTTIKTALWFLDEGEEINRTYTRAEALAAQKSLVRETKRMLSDTAFQPKPSNACRWCWYGQAKKAKGGPGRCQY
jgi:CRISPR/Cas system-associated exonuclease Cas4 (RecB family)